MNGFFLLNKCGIVLIDFLIKLYFGVMYLFFKIFIFVYEIIMLLIVVLVDVVVKFVINLVGSLICWNL